jgi:Pyridoxamine 5'-phosphate oxidase
VLNIATVTRRGEPRLSAVDGHLLHGRWYFSTSADSPKSRQMVSRPAISASYTPRDGLGVFLHGVASRLPDASERAALHRHLVLTYGMDPAELAEEIAYFRIDADWLVGFAMTPAEQAEIDALERPVRLDPWLE